MPKSVHSLDYIPSVERVLFAARDLPQLRPDVSQDLDRYRKWATTRQAERQAGHQAKRPTKRQAETTTGARSDIRLPEGTPTLTLDVVVVVADPDPAWLDRGLGSIASQTVGAWALHLAVIGPLDATTEAVVGRYLRQIPGGLLLHFARETPTAEAVRASVAGGSAGAWISLDGHDQLAPDAVELLLGALGFVSDPVGDRALRADAAYGDEDRVDDAGQLRDPVLKPGWSPELLLSLPYVGRPVVWRRASVDEAGGIRPVPDGDWEHDLMLRVAELGGRYAHVPEVLCHRPADGPSVWDPVPNPEHTTTPLTATPLTATPTGAAPGAQAVTDALRRRGETGCVTKGPLAGSWWIRRRSHRYSASIIIPFRDGARFLRTCTESVFATTGDERTQIVLVDNGSVEPETQSLLDRLGTRPDVTILHDDRPFNWSELNNMAVDHVQSDVLVFMNNDVEALHRGWLEQMASHVQRAHVGAVGARLLYPNGRVQHAGVVLGMGGAAGHVLAGLSRTLPGYLGMAVLTRDCTAVTGACLVTGHSVFDTLNGFDASFGTDLNDIDYCLRAARSGKLTIYEPLVEMIHYESPTRGTSANTDEIAAFIDRWYEAISAGDDHLNCHLSRIDSACALRTLDESEWWSNWRLSLGRS